MLVSFRARSTTKCKLTDGPLDVEFDPGHLREQVDVGAADRTAAEPHVGGHKVQRLCQHADIFEDELIGDRAVLPRNATETRRDGDQDLGRGRCAHGELCSG